MGQNAEEPDPDAAVFRRRAPRGELVGSVLRIVGYHEAGIGLSGGLEPAALVVPLVISFGDPFAIALGRTSASNRWESFAAGLYAGPVAIASDGRAACVQIDFTPLGARRFFGLPPGELANRIVAIDDLGDAGILRLRQALGEAGDWERRLDIAEAFTIGRLRRGPAPGAEIAWAIARITATRGSVRITELAAEIGWSRKHFSGRFRAEFGLLPKAVARISRLEHALEIATAEAAAPWAGIAADTGYADQAHLTRDFTDLAGRTPAAWRASLRSTPG